MTTRQFLHESGSYIEVEETDVAEFLVSFDGANAVEVRDVVVHVPQIPQFAVVAKEEVLGRVDERVQALIAAPEITDQTTLNEVRAVVKSAKALWNEIEASRQTVKAPYLDACAKIDAAARPLLNRLQEVMDEGKNQQGQYLIARDRQIAADEAARRLAEIEAMKDTSRLTAPLIAPTLPSPIAAPLQKSPRAVVVDAKLVPDEYWVIDQAKINYDALVLKKTIPGVEVKDESIVAAR